MFASVFVPLFSSLHRRHLPALALLGLASTTFACFSGQIDPNQGGVFACSNLADCDFNPAFRCIQNLCNDPNLSDVYACSTHADCDFNPEFRCVSQVCVADIGPTLSIESPTLGQRIPVTETEFSISLRAMDFSLTPAGTGTSGQGYLELALDERKLPRVENGDIANGIKVAIPSDWVPSPGLHRIAAQAMRPDGTAYSNTDSLVFTAFWIDDRKPHVGIVAPHPLKTFAPGEAVNLTAAAINFNFVSSSSGIAFDPNNPTGHLHVFFDTLLPDCLGAAQSCKDKYTALVEPSQGPPVSIFESSNTLIPMPHPAATTRMSIVAQYSNHTTFPSEVPAEVVLDSILLRVEKK